MTSRMFVVRALHHRQAVQAQRRCRACGGAAHAQGVEQKAEALFGLLGCHPQDGEQARLHFRVVNTDGAAAALP